MRPYEEQIQNILRRETELPEVVNAKKNLAFSVIQKQAGIGQTEKKKSARSIKAAVIAFAVAVSIGTTAYAAVKHFGILEYLNQRNKQIPEEATSLVTAEVEQQEKEEQLVDFKIREYLCDSNQVYLVVEAKPADPERYLIVPQMVMEEDSVENLNMEGLTEGTVGEYAAARGKELLEVSAYVNTGAPSSSHDFKTEQDGTALFIISSANELDEKVNELRCETVVRPLASTNEEDIIRDSFTFTMTDNSSERELKYVITDTKGADVAGLGLEDVVITETEFGIHVEFFYHCAENLTTEQQKQIKDIGFQILGEDGEELEGASDATGWAEEIEEGRYREVRNYEKVDLPDELNILVKNFFSKETFGYVKMEKE